MLRRSILSSRAWLELLFFLEKSKIDFEHFKISYIHRRGLAVACLVGGPMYALGGLDDNTCYNTVERYDPESNTWSTVKDMNFPRGGVAVAAMKVRFLVFYFILSNADYRQYMQRADLPFWWKKLQC